MEHGNQLPSGHRYQHNPSDAGPTTDISMKQGRVSPTSFPAQKRTYRSQKKEAAKELLSTITDPAVVLLGDWLKVRGTLKSWTKLWCVLKPGVLILYKSDKHKGSQWVGTILLSTCQLLERPSKKDGFCFKLFHPLDQSIWATKGPKGETIGAFVQPLPYSYCIFRAPSESAGKCWMDALELALKCTSLLERSMTRLDSASDTAVDYDLRPSHPQSGTPWPVASCPGEDDQDIQNGTNDDHGDTFAHNYNSMRAQEGSMNDSDVERHFDIQGQGRRPSLVELQYAVTSVKLKKLTAERQKLELEKENLRMDILVKEEHLNQEFGKGNWHKMLRQDSVDKPFTPCSPSCIGACLAGGSCVPGSNRSQNRQDLLSYFPVAREQISTVPWWSDSDGEHAVCCRADCGVNTRSTVRDGWMKDEHNQRAHKQSNITSSAHFVPQQHEWCPIPSSHAAQKELDFLVRNNAQCAAERERIDLHQTETLNVTIRKRGGNQKRGRGEQVRENTSAMKRLS